ncbi:hypothetical protein OSTOST_05193 [Ostertagia ostertagi]
MCVAVHGSKLACYIGTQGVTKNLQERVAPDGYFCTFTVDSPCNFKSTYRYEMKPSDKQKDFCDTKPPLTCYCNQRPFCNVDYRRMKHVWDKDAAKVSNRSIRVCMENFLNKRILHTHKAARYLFSPPGIR